MRVKKIEYIILMKTSHKKMVNETFIKYINFENISTYLFLSFLGNLNLEFRPSETTLSNSRMCKQLLENKYHVLFKIINNNEIYNPLTIVKNRRNDLAREGSDHSLGSSEKYGGGNSNRLISGRIKSRGSLPRRKELSIWYVSHMEIIKDFEQRNTLEVFPGKQIVRTNNHGESNDDKYYQKKRQKYPQLSQIFSPPPIQEIQ